jgi:hypothetical protein
VVGQIGATAWIITSLGLPNDDPILDVNVPGTRARAIDPVGRTDLLVILPSFSVEILPIPLAAANLSPVSCKDFFFVAVTGSKEAKRGEKVSL